MDLIFAASDLDHFIFHTEICEDVWAPAPPSDFAALAGALILTNLGQQHRRREGGHQASALRNAIRAMLGGLCLFGGRARRVHDRPRLGRPGLHL